MNMIGSAATCYPYFTMTKGYSIMKKTLILAGLVLALATVFSSCSIFAITEDTTVEIVPVDPDGETTTADPDGDTTTVEPDGETTTVDSDETTTEDPSVDSEPQFDNVYHTVIDYINGKGPGGASVTYSNGLGASAFELGRQEMVDAVADQIQVTEKGRLIVTGWIALFGGVNKYVYRITEGESVGEWMDAVGGSDAPHYESIFLQFGCFASEKNAAFQENPLILDLNAYDGKTISIEIAAVPEIMQEARVTFLTIIDLAVDIPEASVVEGAYDIEGNPQSVQHVSYIGNMVFDFCVAGTAINLGTIDLSKYTAIKITYGSDPAAPLNEEGHTLVLTSTGAVADGSNKPIEYTALAISDILTNATSSWKNGAREITIALNTDYNGEVYLCHDMPSGHGIVVSQIIFVEK